MDMHSLFIFMVKVGVAYEAWKVFKRLCHKAWHVCKK